MDYIPHTEAETKEMLREIGIKSLDDLFKDIPKRLRNSKFNLPHGLAQLQLIRLAHNLSKKNTNLSEYLCFRGAGAYEHFIPAAVEKIVSLPGFLTSYTPYQAEANQGTLRTIFEYQTLISELTGMEIANASLYDGATALTEALAMVLNLTGKKEVLLPKTLHPEYRKVVETLLEGLNIQIIEIPYSDGITDLEALKKNISEKTAAVTIQQPNFFGCLEEVEEIEKMVHDQGAIFIVCSNPISLGILKRPGDYGADIVVGEGQPLGIPLNFGGPYLGFMAGPMKWQRQMPGRIVGMAKDKDGKTAFTLVLQTREQHIRRHRATSNICTNSNLNAISLTVALKLLGQKGLKKLALDNIENAHYLQERISELNGFRLKFSAPFFNEFVIESQRPLTELNKELLDQKIIGGLNLGKFYPELENCLLFCATETKTKKDIDYLVKALGGEDLNQKISPKSPQSVIEGRFLQQVKPVIPKLTEAQAIKHFSEGSELNFSVDTHFYPLGSCSMKLSPKENEEGAKQPGFLKIHPYQPEELTQGTFQLLWETEKWFSEICGMKRFSLQPAAGAHGELTGLLMIRTFHRKAGNPRKTVLIPDSAHGTNPASVARCGYEPILVKSTKEGEVDLEDLARKTNEETAGLMITLPNTLGLFEKQVLKITDILHQAGALVYMDGANLNALLGICKPGEMGIDVLHLNLHKTFSTPHGGGGPGSGPIGAVEKLVPFLPVPLIDREDQRYSLNYAFPDSIGKVSTFYGNIGVIIKAYLYLRTLGKEGLKKVAQHAVLNANYLRVKLQDYYYLPHHRLSLHEVIFLIKNQRERLGGANSSGPIAKRLLDKGFYAFTQDFPFPGALMIEPTETENKETLDEFIRALIEIDKEIKENPELVKSAPHTTPVKKVLQAEADRHPILRYPNQKPS